MKSIPQGKALTIDGKFAFLLLPGDADAAMGETLDMAAMRAAAALQRIVAESQESRDLETILGNLAMAASATAVAALVIWLLARLRGLIAKGLAGLGSLHADRLKVGGQVVFGREQVFALARFVTILIFWLLVAFVVYEWLAFTLSRFPWTRPWGEGLLGAAFNLAVRMATAMLGSLPNLAVAATIFWIAWLVSRIVDRTLDPFVRGIAESARIDRDTARPTRNLLKMGIWVFAVAMAYPYLPGSDSEAFKGLSVLVGLMISLGSTSLVGQAASGLIVMYTRTLRPGEFVRIGEHEGTVVELGAFTTKIRTGLGEELTISNSTIAGGITKNYSRAVKGSMGFIVDTVVTIGYDTPWRQVHEMLIEAARRTDGVLSDPAPLVFQTGLTDFYPEYRLVAQASPSRPLPRAIVMSELHANIQDVFNEHGVQIMSPHYLGDPAEAKVVPPAKWYPAPAKKPE
ncbi:MAG: mechanosensitive ion channel family protein [Betaproteobacteria bacterium]|nr:mechanosensitive ion channel family protein [Betaproteobacteria bacterium]